MYNGYRIIFDGKGEWNFGNDSARNVIIFGVDNNSLYHNDNPKNNFCVLDEGPTYDINGSFGTSVKNLVLGLVKKRHNFAWNVITIMIIVICLLMKNKSISWKQIIKM